MIKWKTQTPDLQMSLEERGDIFKRLKQMPPKLQKKGARNAARRGMVIARDDAKAKAKTYDDEDSPEKIWKNIVVQESSSRSRRVGGIVMRVGVRGGSRRYSLTKHNVRKGRISASGANAKSYKTGGASGNPGGDTWYWRFLEFGTKRQRAKPFLAPALSSNLERITSTVARELDKEITKLSSTK